MNSQFTHLSNNRLRTYKMALKEIIQLLLPLIAYVITFLYQKQKIESLTSAINLQKDGIAGQKASIDAHTTVVAALKGQADGQIAITTKLESLLERVEKNASSVLRDHEAILKLRDQRAEGEKEALSKQLEEAKLQLSEREVNIKDAGVKPEIADLFTSLSRESYDMKETVAALRSEFSEFASSSQQLVISVQHLLATPEEVAARSSLRYSLIEGRDHEFKARRLHREQLVTNIIVDFINLYSIDNAGPILINVATTRHQLQEACKEVAPEIEQENPKYFYSAVQKMTLFLIEPLKRTRYTLNGINRQKILNAVSQEIKKYLIDKNISYPDRMDPVYKNAFIKTFEEAVPELVAEDPHFQTNLIDAAIILHAELKGKPSLRNNANVLKDEF